LNPVQKVAASVFAAAFALLRRMGAPPCGRDLCLP